MAPTMVDLVMSGSVENGRSSFVGKELRVSFGQE